MVDPALATAETLAEGFEGFSATPYRCPAGVWTIGYGSTRDAAGAPVCATTPAITRDQARDLALRDMTSAFTTVVGNVKVPLTSMQRAALLDFVYNLGSGNFRSSTLLRKLNAGDFAGAAAEFDKWDMAGGKPLAGLLRRREAERKLFTGEA